MALQLSLRPKNPKTLTNPSLIHLFSSNSSAPSDPNDEPTGSSSSADTGSAQSPMSSYFSDVKARLKQQQQSPSPSSARKPSYPFTSVPNRPSSPASKAASLEEIRKNLSEFRSRSSVPPPSELGPTPSSASSSWQRGISFQELYKRNAMRKGDDGSAPESGRSGMLSFDSIRESLRQVSPSKAMQNERKSGDSMSLSAFKNSLKLKPTDPASTSVFGGSERLPASVFGKEMMDRKQGENEGMKTEFVKMYSHGELGTKLRALRPEKAKEKNWFSLTELNERLMKLRTMEEKETESKIGGISFQDLRESLVKMKMSDDEKAKKTTIQRLDILGQLGRTPNHMLQPPQEHLVEKYFHPDNMSSAEKLKIELAKVREEFKMSESDCGSARVQVAQLTTKINHLTAVLHKKDKHSKKGLLAMVQLRKKLLKYLRRTDWESYCMVLNKLGLRDNPDYKN
ncbi:uncharacterized protein LOC111452150 [Cucurbita moschata]|uniref:Small ribosomal subunit protein uS15c n=1 Tax=Cucurbita moschata TaxID=3662 RepID=A0A6J1G9E3_CUCMO|nr:uncharacterized protein LOC111452150 [Cucurbita moschata]